MPKLNIDDQAAAQLDELLTLPLTELNTKWQDASRRLRGQAYAISQANPFLGLSVETDTQYLTIKREARLLELAIGIVSAAEAHDHPRECKHADCDDWCEDDTQDRMDHAYYGHA